MRSVRPRLVLALSTLTLGCGSGGPPRAPAPAPVPRAAAVAAREEPAESPAALFDRLVADVRRYHLFAPQTAKNLGRTWEDDLPLLRAEFAAAKSPEALRVVLHHFGNSLHDVHCQFRADERGERLTLGFTVGFEQKADGFELYVERVAKSAPPEVREALHVGDVLVAVDGVPASGLVRHHALESNMNAWPNVANGVARFLTARRTSVTTARAGATSTFVVRPRSGGAERTLVATWRPKEGTDAPDDVDIDYATNDCVFLDPKDYGPYTLAARGYRTCVYTSTAPKFRDYPIVRQASFRYDEIPHGPIVDQAFLSSTLARLKPKGVLLDVQENGGGINPNVFLDWWGNKPYVDTETHVLLDPSLPALARGPAPRVSSWNGAMSAWYAAELAARTEGQRVTRGRPFQCKADTCAWDNRYVPKHRVTSAPVALLLGPGCASSCDAVAYHFAEQRFGPVVGRPSMGGFTTHRLETEVVFRGKRLGSLSFAVAYDTAPGGTESIEAVPVHIDVPVPRTFENHARYDAVLVEAAIEALRR